MNAIIDEYRLKKSFYAECCSSLMRDLLFCAARFATETSSRAPSRADEVISYVHEHYAEHLTNETIAARFFYHPNYISSLIKKQTGQPLHRYLLNYRMHRAIILLQSTDMTVMEVAEKVGMPDIKHFSKCFRQIMGKPPSHFQ